MLSKFNFCGGELLNHSLYQYDKTKVNVLKCILPFGIILQHMCNNGYPQLHAFGSIDAIIMWLFFAMSGYGLVFSYMNNEKYIEAFLSRSMIKLFVPYVFALCLFFVYRACKGIDQIELFQMKGLWSFVPASWFIWTLAFFYIFFYVIFRFTKGCVAIRVVMLCVAIMGYRFIAPHIGIETWRYERCPGFCIGAIFAFLNKPILDNLKKWHILLLIMVCLALRNYIEFLYYSDFVILFFLVMYFVPVPVFVENLKIVKFISSISFELYIFQFIPIYIVANDFGINSAVLAVCTVIFLDIAIAYVMHKLNKLTTQQLQQKRRKVA